MIFKNYIKTNFDNINNKIESFFDLRKICIETFKKKH